MTFANRTPPQFDVEALKKWDSNLEEKDQIEKYLLCGFNKGSIIFMKTTETETIYSRFSFHREAVVFISELHHRGHYMTYCKENIWVIWGFSAGDERICAFRTFNTHR